MKYPVEKYTYHVAKKVDGTPYQVIAVSTYAGKIVRGVAKCDPRDEFSIENGKKLAAARCAVKVAERRAKRAEKKFKDACAAMTAQEAYANRMKQYALDSINDLCDARTELRDTLDSM